MRDRISENQTFLPKQIRTASAHVVLGRGPNSAGAVQELTLSGLSISGGVLAVTGKPITRTAAQGKPVDGSTNATEVGQFCIVGNSGGNRVVYQCVQLSPSRWQLVSAGIIENPNTAGAFLRITVDSDGAIATQPYSLT